MKKKNILFIFIVFLVISLLIIYLKFSKDPKEESITKIEEEVKEEPYTSPI